MSQIKTPDVFNFAFKGRRDYVQGTDMYMSFRDHVALPTKSSIETLSFNGFLRGDARLIELDDPRGSKLPCVAYISGPDGMRVLGLEQIGPVSKDTSEYLEEEIVECGVFSESGITLDRETGYDTIEEIIALIKKWSNVNRPVDGSWVFARIDALDGSPPFPAHRTDELHIEFSAAAGRKFTRFAVSSGESKAMVTFGVNT